MKTLTKIQIRALLHHNPRQSYVFLPTSGGDGHRQTFQVSKQYHEALSEKNEVEQKQLSRFYVNKGA